MTLSVAMVARAPYRVDPRLRQQAELLARRGDRVVVFALGEESGPFRLGGVEVRPLSGRFYRGPHLGGFVKENLRFLAKAGARLLRCHLNNPFDVILVQASVDALVSAGALPKLLGARVILEVNERTVNGLGRRFGFGSLGRVAKIAKTSERLSAAAADVVVARDPFQYQMLLSSGVPARKLGVHLDVADPTFFPAKKKWSKNPSRVVWHGDLRRDAGVALAIQAFAAVHAQKPNVRFCLLGSGAHESQMRALANELNLGPDILEFVAGDLPLEERGALLSAHDVGVYSPSQDVPDRPPAELIRYLQMGLWPVSLRSRSALSVASPESVVFCEDHSVLSLKAGIVEVLENRERRQEMLAAREDWLAEFGFEAQEKVFFRTVDALCLEKILAEKKAAKSTRSVNTDVGSDSRPSTPAKKVQKAAKKVKTTSKNKGDHDNSASVRPGGV